jgi:hypothetical protein
MKRIFLVPLLGFMAACKPVGIADQAALSRPIFEFNATGPRALECGLVGQLETGRSASSNVAAGGCASCQ